MSNNKQQTAVEWLQDILESFGNKHEIQMTWSTLEGLLSRAKEMEKEQIIDAHLTGLIHPLEMEATKQAEHYYNETFKTKKP
jgi:hypothetical protein